MRISTKKDDPGYRGDATNGATAIYLDGTELEFCHTADEEEGIAICYIKDEEGNYLKDEKDQDKLKETTFHGNIKIERTNP